MFYLFLAILCSASIALIFKYTENNNTNRYVITSANYFIAFVTSFIMILYNRLFDGVVREMPFIDDVKLFIENDQHILSPYSSIIWGNHYWRNCRRILLSFLYILSKECQGQWCGDIGNGRKAWDTYSNDFLDPYLARISNDDSMGRYIIVLGFDISNQLVQKVD